MFLLSASVTFLQYSFEAENPYQDSSDPYNTGLQKRLDGDLPSAILLFEAALQKDPEHIKAWEVLGKSKIATAKIKANCHLSFILGLTLAENEQDPGAITAYKRCLALEPTNLVAIMGLAVSYTNESYQLQACQALEVNEIILCEYTRINHSRIFSGLAAEQSQVRTSDILFIKSSE